MDHCKMELKKAHHDDEFKKKLINRLKRIEGQVRGVQKMIESDVYCDDIINQISAIKSALGSVSKSLLEAHLNTCVLEQIQSGSLDVLAELRKTIDRMTKN